ncbi:MAG: hypothetical protein Q4G28_07460 [Neisseria sp.]|nr:hypothetical protein [Neisseria sp.]
MTDNKRTLSALLLSLALLGGCGEQKEQIKQEIDNKFRAEFVGAFTRQCVDSIPAGARLDAEQKLMVCDCAAQHAVEAVSAAEIAQAVAGNIPPELHNKLSTAVTPCLTQFDASLRQPEPASSASQP